MSNPTGGGPALPTDPELRAKLLRLKLRALVSEQFGDGERVDAGPRGIPGLTDADGRAFVLVPPDVDGTIGGALHWAQRENITDLHFLVDDDAAALARRIAGFSPRPTVWEIDERSLTEASPAEFAARVEPAGAALEALADAASAGAEIVVEHGQVMIEVEGLEIGRVSDDTVVGGALAAGAELAPMERQAGWHVDLGIGRFDREAYAMMHRIRENSDGIAEMVDTVREYRKPGAAPHLLNNLVRQRWLRAAVLRDPALVGASRLEVAEPIRPREGLRDQHVAHAIGELVGGQPVVVAFSVGVDLDLVVDASEARDRHHAWLGMTEPPELIIVTPERDQYSTTRLLSGALRQPAELIAIEGPWMSGR